MRYHRPLIVLSLFLLLPVSLMTSVRAARAQEPHVRVTVVPRLGMLTSSDELFREFNYRDDDGFRGSVARLAPSPAVGLTVAVAAQPYGIALRATVLRSVLAHLDATGYEGYICTGSCVLAAYSIWAPSVHEHDIDAVVLQAALEAAFDLRLGSDLARPYLLAGVAAKRYDFGDPEPADGVGFTFPHGARGYALQAGVGVRLRLLGPTLDLQVLDSYNTYRGRRLHDVFFLVGVPLRLR
jgi:hypothetical protein